MAGAKRKKKPAANPARGFATTSIASKARPEPTEGPENAPEGPSQPRTAAARSGASSDPATEAPPSTAKSTATSIEGDANEKPLTADEFAQQLEESDLQLLVDKYGPKVRRDAARQRSRLETDRRLLRGQAESLNTRRWLPPELMNHILDLVQGEYRFSSSGISSEKVGNGRMLPEEDIVIRLWTLKQTLDAAGFPSERVQAVVRHILDISPSIPTSVKDGLWGLDEAMDWLAIECSLDELPKYESQIKPNPRPTGKSGSLLACGWMMVSRAQTANNGKRDACRKPRGIRCGNTQEC